VTYSPLRPASEQVEAVLVISRDLTKHVLALEDLREGIVTLLNEEREKAACRRPSSDRRAPGVHRRSAEATVRRR
jgi:hypothetical protein